MLQTRPPFHLPLKFIHALFFSFSFFSLVTKNSIEGLTGPGVQGKTKEPGFSTGRVQVQDKRTNEILSQARARRTGTG